MDVDNTRQRVLSVSATLDGDSEDGLGLFDSDSEIPLLVGHDKCTLHNKKQPIFPPLHTCFHALSHKINRSLKFSRPYKLTLLPYGL
jgi:hypothetical protein